MCITIILPTGYHHRPLSCCFFSLQCKELAVSIIESATDRMESMNNHRNMLAKPTKPMKNTMRINGLVRGFK